MERGEFYNISLKGVPKSVKAKKIKWKSSNKKVVSIYSKKKNKAVLRAKKCGNAKITAIYKGRKYTCKVTVVKDPEQKKAANPTLNSSSVVIRYLPDYALPYIKKNAAYNYSFQFTVSGTDESVRRWRKWLGISAHFMNIGWHSPLGQNTLLPVVATVRQADMR